MKQNRSKDSGYTKRFFLLVIAVMLLAFLPRFLAFSRGAGMTEDGLYRPHNPDAYYYLRMSRYCLGEDIGIRENTDLMRYVPEGVHTEDAPLLLSELTALLSRLSGRPVYETARCLELFLPQLVVIPVMLLLFSVLQDLDLTGGFVPAGLAAGVLSGCNSMYLQRTLPGYFDTDLLIPFFGMFLMFFLYRLLSGRSLWPSAMGLALSAGLFARWWSGSVFFFLTAAGIAAVWLIPGLLPGPRTWRRILPPLAAFAAMPAGILLFASPAIFKSLLTRILILVRLQDDSSFRPGEEWFPNAYQSIKEMAVPDILQDGFFGLFRTLTGSGNGGVINYAGGIFVCLAAVSAVIFLLIRMVQTHEPSDGSLRIRCLFTFFFLWLTASVLGALQAVRYQMILALPLSVLAGIAAAIVYRYFSERERLDGILAALVLLTALLFPTAYAAVAAGVSPASSFPTPQMEREMAYIRENTPEDTVIASWWDFGYYFEEIGNRATLFDGGTQSGMRLYLMAKALTTDDASLSAGILRMLAASGDEALITLTERFQDGGEAVTLLMTLLSMDPGEAPAFLESAYGMSSDEAAELVSLIHPSDGRPLCLLISRDMIAKSKWFPFFGNWKGTGTETSGDFYYLLNGYTLGAGALQDGENHYEIKTSPEGTVELKIERIPGTVPAVKAEITLPEADFRCRLRHIWYYDGGRAYDYPAGGPAYQPADKPSDGDMDGAAGKTSEKWYDLILLEDRGRMVVSLASPALSDSLCGRLYLKDGHWESHGASHGDRSVDSFILVKIP